jgi:hypothetical protein
MQAALLAKSSVAKMRPGVRKHGSFKCIGSLASAGAACVTVCAEVRDSALIVATETGFLSQARLNRGF